MTTGSLVLLVFYLFWGIMVLLLLFMDYKGVGMRRHDWLRAFLGYAMRRLQALIFGIRQESKALAGQEEDYHVLLVITLKFGYLLFAITLIRLVFAPDLLILILTVIYLFISLGSLLYLSRLPSSSTNWQNLYELDSDYGVLEITLTPDGPGKEWIGSTLAELNLRKRELLVLAVIRKAKFTVFPKGPEILTSGDRVLVFGKYPPFGFSGYAKSTDGRRIDLMESLE
jgi:hypothetical protein